MPRIEGRYGFSIGITNPGGKNFKIVTDPHGNVSKKPIGTVSIFTGKAWWMFAQKKAEGKLEYVRYGDMSPAEQAMIRNLKYAKSLQFPLARFRTINTNKLMPNRLAGTDDLVPNEDIGAMNVFLYLGDSPELGKLIPKTRDGIERGRKIELKRAEARLEGNWTKKLYATR